MKCDEARDLLTERLLDSLPPGEDAELSKHLRGCAGCRRELIALGEGLATFAEAAHSADPPRELRERVLRVLEEERAQAPPARSQSATALAPVTPLPERPRSIRSRGRPAGVWRKATAAVAAAVALVAALTWGAVETDRAIVQRNRADALQDAAASYQRFLEALGGRDVRVATLKAAGAQPVEGSAILYDSADDQSWVLVLVRAPGMTGRGRAVLSTGGRRIEMPPMRFGRTGEAGTWLVTSFSIAGFDRIRVFSPSGELLASGSVSGA